MITVKEEMTNSYHGIYAAAPSRKLSDIPPSKVYCSVCHISIAHQEPGKIEVLFGSLCESCQSILNTVCIKNGLDPMPVNSSSWESWRAWLNGPKQLMQQINGNSLPPRFGIYLRSIESSIKTHGSERG